MKELRLRGICTVEAGNAFLEEFGEDYSRRNNCSLSVFAQGAHPTDLPT